MSVQYSACWFSYCKYDIYIHRYRHLLRNRLSFAIHPLNFGVLILSYAYNRKSRNSILNHFRPHLFHILYHNYLDKS